MIEVRPLPMKEAVQYWKSKTLMSPGDFAKLSDEAKTYAFGVSGIAKGAELESVYHAIGKAIGQGMPFGAFKKECAAVFERRGWTGARAWRVDNIFRTNVQTAFMTGRYQQLMRVAAVRPYWQYSAVNDKRTRPAHAALNGMVFLYDHPFWDSWFPPNGYRCRCTVKSLSEKDMTARGLTAEQRDPTGSYTVPTDPKTGNPMPPVAVMPDPGFAYNPGKNFWQGMAPREDTRDLVGLGALGIQDAGSRNYLSYHRPALADLPRTACISFSDQDLLPDIESLLDTGMSEAQAEEYYVGEFLKMFGLALGETTIITDKTGEPLMMGDALFRAGDGGLKITKRGRERYVKLLARTIMDPYEIWLVARMNAHTGRIVLRRRYIRAFVNEDRKIAGYAAFEYGHDGWSGVTAFMPDDLTYADHQRLGKLLYGE